MSEPDWCVGDPAELDQLLDDFITADVDLDADLDEELDEVSDNNNLTESEATTLLSLHLDLLNRNGAWEVRKSNELSVDDLDLGGLRISGDPRPTRPTSLFPKTKQHEADDELKEVDEKRTTPEPHRGEWGPESLGLWHSGPSSLGFTQPINNNQDTSSVMSFSSSVCAGTVNAPVPRRTYSHQQLGTKVEMVYNLLSMLGTSDREDMSKTLLAMSSTAESCQAMRQSGCLPLLIQLIHAAELERPVRARAAEALHNIVHAQTDDKRRRREARVLKLLQTVREHCDLMKTEGGQVDSEKHPGAAVAALMKFSFDAEHRQAMCTLGGLHAIAELTQVEHESHGSMTEETQCVNMRRYAGMALTNLTFGDGANKALLCSLSKFMEALVAQLTSPSEDLRQVTASVIRNLSWRADAGSKTSLREVGAVTALMAAAMEAMKEPTLKSILSALWNLSAHCSMNKVDICSVPGALAFLVRTLRYKATSNTLGIIENAGGILRNVSSHVAVREDYRQILRDAGCFEVLLEQLKSPSLTVVSNACGTLWNLSARCAEDQRRLWDMGATSMLRSLVQSKHKMIAMGSSAALKNLLAANPNGNMMAHLDSTARGLGLQNLPTLFARKQRALEQELDATLAATVGTMELDERHPCRRSDSKESVTSTQSDSVYERVARGSGKVLENKDVTLHDSLSETGGSSRRNNEAKLLRRFRSSGIPTPVSRKQPDETVNTKLAPKRAIPVFKSRLKPPPNSKSLSPRFGSGTLPRPAELEEEELNECPVNYSLQYRESEQQEKETKPLPPVPVTNDLYAETDLDQPTDFSLKYGEEVSSDEDIAAQRYGYYDSNKNETEDTIRTYYTEGTPYEGTPYNFSSANSMSDLRLDPNDSDSKAAAEEKGKESPKLLEESIPVESGIISDVKGTARQMGSGVSTPDRPIQYCEEGTPGGCFSRVSSLSSLSGKDSNKTSPGKKEKESKKLVTFTVDETPLMFSRSSSLTSLNSLAPPLPDQDGGSSVVSTFSRVTSGAISPSDLPDSPTQTVPPSGAPSVIVSQQPVMRPHRESIFDDSLERYKEEGTPIEFSRQTSLSCLTCEQTGSSGSSVSGEEGKMKVVGVDGAATTDPGQDRLELSSVSEGDEDTDEHILADCISIGMQDTRNRPRVAVKSASKPVAKLRCGIPIKAVAPRHVYEDSVQTYHTEDTPASISHAGSNSDLSVPQPEDGSCNSSDTENILNECIHSGMPQGKLPGGISMGMGLGKRVVPPATAPVNDLQETKRKDVACARDELSNFATENSPCTFSVRSSLSDLTVNTSDSLGPPNLRNGLMISPVLNSTSHGASPSSISLVDSEDGAKEVADEKRDGWDDKLSRPNTRASSDAGQPTSTSEDLVTALSRSLSVESFDSCEPTPQEQALLEQCIHSGMPHRPKNVSGVSAAGKGVATVADADIVDAREKNPSEYGRGRNSSEHGGNTMANSVGNPTWSDDVMVASGGGHTWSDDVSVTSLGSVGSNDQDGLRVVEAGPRPAFRVGDTVTSTPVVAREAARVSRELRRLHEAEMLTSVTSDLSLVSVDSFLDAELAGLELPDRPTPDFLASEDHPVTLKLLKLKNNEPTSVPSLGPLHIDFDLEGSMISVASITSEIAESATLADGSDTEIPEDDFSSHSQESLPRDESSPRRIPRKLTPKEKRRLTQDRYRTYTVDELRAKCEQERLTPKQKRLNDKERFLTRTISVEEKTDKYSTYRVRKDRPMANGKVGLSPAEKLQVVANATLVANTLTSEPGTYQEGAFAVAEQPDISIDTETFVAKPAATSHGMRVEPCDGAASEPDEATICDENGLTNGDENGLDDDGYVNDEDGNDDDDDPKGPRITVPTAPTAAPPKAVRGRRKPLYSSPRRNAPPPPPLVREGTFTKEEGSGKGSRLPDAKTLGRPGIPRPAAVNKTAPPRPTTQKRPASVGPHHSSQQSSNNAMKRHSASAVPTMRNSSSNHSIKSTGSVKSLGRGLSSPTPASPDKSDKTRQGPGRPKTPKKEVTSKIASLWKKVEETKKSKGKGSKDNRVWITPKPEQQPVTENGDADEVLVIEQEEVVELASGKIVRSSTFQGDGVRSKPLDQRVKTVRNSGDFSAWSSGKGEARQSAIVPPFNYNPPSSTKSADLNPPQTNFSKKVTSV